MQIQISPFQCFCSFGDSIVYEFVPTLYVLRLNNCRRCVFWSPSGPSKKLYMCLSVPCQKENRKDNFNGFWQISQTVDYQQFTKMLKIGG